MLGQMMAYAAAPEFFAREGFFPGIWYSGQRGSGKTTLARI
jgi:DNA polymerase III gamma/tau subunit